jgi:hypothetical protein
MGYVPAFVDEVDVARIPAEEELEEEEPVAVGAPAKTAPPARPSSAEPTRDEVVSAEPVVEGDGARRPEEPEPERLVGAGAGSQRRQRNAKRKRQRQRRRKHGRNR